VAAVLRCSLVVGDGYCSTGRRGEVRCVAKIRMGRPGRWSSLVKADDGYVSAKISARSGGAPVTGMDKRSRGMDGVGVFCTSKI
jgi:hypothetical protein